MTAIDAAAPARNIQAAATEPIRQNSSDSIQSTEARGGGDPGAELVAQIDAAITSGNNERLSLALTTLIPSLVARDPGAAARFAESVSDAELRAEIIQLVARWWAAKDPDAAMHWAAKLSSREERDVTLTDVALQVAATDPAKAFQLRAAHVPPGEPQSGLAEVAQLWAEANLPLALSWVLTQTQGEQRDALLSRLAYVQSRNAPADAATLVTTHVQPGPIQDEAVMTVLHQWAQRDSSAASAWVQRFPVGPLRQRAEQELAIIARPGS